MPDQLQSAAMFLQPARLGFRNLAARFVKSTAFHLLYRHEKVESQRVGQKSLYIDRTIFYLAISFNLNRACLRGGGTEIHV